MLSKPYIIENPLLFMASLEKGIFLLVEGLFYLVRTIFFVSTFTLSITKS